MTRTGTLGTPLRLSEDTVPEMIRNRNGSPVAKAVSVDVALTLIEYANEREELRELLADLAMEGKIVGLGDAVAEVNDQTGVLGRARAVLGNDFLEGKASL